MLWLVVFAAYAATIGLHAFGRSDYAGDEPHYLLTAKSLADDGNPDLRDEYAAGQWSSFYPYPLAPRGELTRGRLDEPQGVGFPLLIAPAYALGGAKGVELFLAALAALAVALAYLLALRVVPDPWALAATLAAALSAPLLAYSTAVYPEMAAAAALCGAALLALRLAARSSRVESWGCFLLLAALPWLGIRFALAGLVIAVYAFRALRRTAHRVLAIACAEIAGFSAALYVGLNEGLYGGATPFAAASHSATGASFPLGYLSRAYRLIALFVDRDYGLLRWAPVFALALFGGWLVWRERRSGLVRAIPGLRAGESAGALCGAAAGAQLLMAAFLAPTMFGFWFPGRQLVAVLPLSVPLIALAMRHVPRLGALLSVLGLAASVWLYVDVRWSGGALVTNRPDWGPLTKIFPAFDRGTTYPFVLAALLGTGALAAIALADRRSRRLAGRLR